MQNISIFVFVLKGCQGSHTTEVSRKEDEIDGSHDNKTFQNDEEDTDAAAAAAELQNGKHKGTQK